MPDRRWLTGLVVGAVVATAEWLRNPHPAWPVLVGLAAAGALAFGRRTELRLGLTAGLLLVLSGLLGGAEWRVGQVTRDWPRERDRRIESVRRGLNRALAASRRETDRLAARALPAAQMDRASAFPRLRRLLPGDGAEMAVAVLESTGVPWAWAGRHRLPPRVEGDSLAVRLADFYVTFEARRHGPQGRVVVATTLVWADSAAPRPDRSLMARMGQATGVHLRVVGPGERPRGEVLDYTEPTTAGERVLFSVEVVPPSRETARAAVLHQAGEWLAGALVIVWLAGLIGARSAGERFCLLAALLWAGARAPLGEALGLGDLFSPATFSQGFLGPLSRSAGDLLLTSAIVVLLALWLGGQRFERRPWMVLVAALLLAAAPYLVSALGRGITPPVNGVAPGLWVTWQVTLALATSAVILLAAAGFRGRAAIRPQPGLVLLGAAIAVAAAIVGVVVWSPQGGWPEWYTFLWAPALLLVALPAPRWASLTGTAVVAGTAAGLVTWGAELDGRVKAAARDLDRLGDVQDPLTEPYLARFADQVAGASHLSGPGELYALWRSSYLAGLEYPVRLELWSPQGTRGTVLALDSLDLPAPLIAALVQGLAPTQERAIVSLLRVPGRVSVLLERLPDGSILAAVVGPRSRLVPPTRLGRLLRPPPEGPPLYRVSLAPPLTGVRGPEEPGTRWWRTGWLVHTDRVLDLPGGARHVHAEIALRDPPALLIRGALVVVLDFAVLALLWLLSETSWPAVRRLSVRRAARSFQVRLAAVLGLFFIVPAAAFTVWSLSQLQDEEERRRDLLIAQALRDAVLTAGGLLQGTDEYLAEGLAELSSRLDAEFALYSGGRLVAASSPILRELALLDPLLDAGTFQRLVLGEELELLRSGTSYAAPVRVGYRVVQAGPPGGVGILATPQLADDGSRSQDRRDLAYGLLFATLLGAGGALVGAQLVARYLSRPVADLRRAAVAVGQAEPLPPHAPPPVEFEAVFGAFERMAADIRASQAALERARQRTAAVLANVATAVVALDQRGAILLANARARQLLGASLPDGSRLEDSAGPQWAALVEAVERFLGGQEPAAVLDLEVAGRQVRLQLARLTAEPGGAVLALDDLTDATQAARVLAWGEMARQVAHEIKNPLTPIRLGMQHLERVRRDRPAALPEAFDATAARILSEIDRLDTIARAFSRFGLPAGEQTALEPVELTLVAQEAVSLYQLARDGVAVELVAGDQVRRPARRDEVKEVLGNLLENARNAGARRIRVTVSRAGLAVEDDGRGIPAELLPRIFEPHFSTTTSGAGLGLPIVKRLVEGWGATIVVRSEVGKGTRVEIRWASGE
jgi:signal transduction histidine kinase